MKIYQLWVYILAALTSLQACVLSKGKESSKAPIIKLLVSIEGGPCKGKCSRYSAEIFSGQKMIYRGLFRMPVIGNFSYFIPEQLPKNLLSEASSLKLAELPDSISSEPGEQRIRISFMQANGILKSISAGNKTGPAAFQSFVKLLDKEVRLMVEDQEGEKIP